MITLHDKETGAFIGEVTEEELQFLLDELEEESPEDRDYYLNRDELDVLEEEGADGALITMLRKALGNRDEMEIQWSRE
jgi:hypothetical protein